MTKDVSLERAWRIRELMAEIEDPLARHILAVLAEAFEEKAADGADRVPPAGGGAALSAGLIAGHARRYPSMATNGIKLTFKRRAPAPT